MSALSRTAPPPALHGPLLALAAALRGETGAYGTSGTSGTTGTTGDNGTSGITGTSGDSDLCEWFIDILSSFKNN